MASTTPTTQELKVTVRELDRLSSCMDRISDNYREYNLLLVRLLKDTADYYRNPPSPNHIEHRCQFHQFLRDQLNKKIVHIDYELLRCKSELKGFASATSTSTSQFLLQELNVSIQELNSLSICMNKVAENFQEYNLVVDRLVKVTFIHHCHRHNPTQCEHRRQIRRTLLDKLKTKITQMYDELSKYKNELKTMSDTVFDFLVSNKT